MTDHPDYDSGLLSDYGGGDVSWWQDYIRSEVGRANVHWRSYAEELEARLGAIEHIAHEAAETAVKLHEEAHHG